MKAVILAAGKGTRMRELTNALPKPMLKVQGKPILEHILGGLSSAGIREVFIVTGYRAEVVEDHIRTHLVDPEKNPGALNADAADRLIEVVHTYLK